MQKVRAKYANGVLTPLEPLGFEEGAVVELRVEAEPAQDLYGAISETQDVLEHICQLPDDDSKKYKMLLDAKDIQVFLDKESRFRERCG